MSLQENTMNQNNLDSLKSRAKQVRRDIIDQTFAAASGHPGGSLSAVEIAVALYFSLMKYDAKNPA